MSNRFSQVQKTTPKAEALLDALKALKASQGPQDSPTHAIRVIYREAFRALQEANPATSYVAIQRHMMAASREERAR